VRLARTPAVEEQQKEEADAKKKDWR